MLDWPSPVPLVAASAHGATLTTIDGQTLDDFCLGDTASMFGHSPPALTSVIAEQAARGLSYMLPTIKSDALSTLLSATFSLPRWQVTTTASEANRAVIRWCRGITGRRKVLTFNGCYHGAVDDAFVDLTRGRPAMRASLVGQVHDLRDTSVVVEFNDEEALAAALAGGDVACVLAEPVMTNVGMVRDAPGFLKRLRQLCDETGTLLVFDETHCISSGFGGHSNMHGPMPDIMVIGKSIGGGVPTAVYGFTQAVATRMDTLNKARPAGHSGIGTTLSANALAIAAMHAMLSSVITREAYTVMLTGAERLVAGLAAVIARHGLPWHVTQVGARVELLCSPTPPINGGEAKAAMQPTLEGLIHLYLVNRGVVLAPFHNMMLVSPVTSHSQIDHLVAAVDGLAAEMLES
ncbi:MAG: aminotransferase class III-fold pyridoxal phosphate-dependent enzyme [Sphingopyxis sp.]|nr:aminotransferase class III-fold pyridoxal phosphate-dependent enzyme [Sphingopyxis sp.]